VTDRRVRLLGFLLVILFIVILGRAVWLQTLRADSLAAMGDRQSRAAVSIPATRGMIQDRHGVALAVGERATTVYANPTLVKDPRRAAITAGRALDVNPDTLYPALRDRSRSFVYLQRKADSERAGTSPSEGLRDSASIRRSAASTRSARPRPTCSGSRARTTGGSPGSRLLSSARWRGAREARHSLQIRGVA